MFNDLKPAVLLKDLKSDKSRWKLWLDPKDSRITFRGGRYGRAVKFSDTLDVLQQHYQQAIQQSVQSQLMGMATSMSPQFGLGGLFGTQRGGTNAW